MLDKEPFLTSSPHACHCLGSGHSLLAHQIPSSGQVAFERAGCRRRNEILSPCGSWDALSNIPLPSYYHPGLSCARTPLSCSRLAEKLLQPSPPANTDKWEAAIVVYGRSQGTEARLLCPSPSTPQQTPNSIKYSNIKPSDQGNSPPKGLQTGPAPICPLARRQRGPKREVDGRLCCLARF